MAEKKFWVIPIPLSHILPVLLLAGTRVIHLVSDERQSVFLFMFSMVCFASLMKVAVRQSEEKEVTRTYAHSSVTDSVSDLLSPVVLMSGDRVARNLRRKVLRKLKQRGVI